MKEIAIVRILVDEETGSMHGYEVWHDPDYSEEELIEVVKGEETDGRGTE